MIIFGEPLHVMGMIFLLFILAFLIGVQVGSLKNEQKKSS